MIAVVGYGAGNLGSVVRALGRIGASASVCTDPADLAGATRVVLPGVGAFAAAMEELARAGWDDALREHVAAERPLLGICLGMQLLGTTGDEGGRTAGLDLIPGEVHHLADRGCSAPTPHIGWNEVCWAGTSGLHHGIPDRTDFYFANSYAFYPSDPGHVIGWVEHDISFPGMVQLGHVYGIQCHPEKSSFAGLRVLQNFVAA